MEQKSKAMILILMFLLVLSVMYGTDIGVPGITKYWNEFKLLDMQFFYTEEAAVNMMRALGANGLQHYLYYFIVDFCFIIVLASIQIFLFENVYTKHRKAASILICLILGRGIADLCEDFLLALIFKGVLSTIMIPFCSVITSLKFAMMILWGIGILLCQIKRSKRRETGGLQS